MEVALEALSKTEAGLFLLTGSEVKVGHCAIINQFDRPESNLVVIIQAIDDHAGMVQAKYLSSNFAMISCYGPLSNAVPLDKFGVSAVAYQGIYSCFANDLEPTAVYPDLSPRRWQEKSPVGIKLRSDVFATALALEIGRFV